VTTVIVLAAQYLLLGLALVAGLVWLVLDRAGKLRLAVAAGTGLAVLGVGIWIAGHLHDDPRPFVQDLSVHPLFPHPADNGFPSDHAAAGGLLSALVLRHRRAVGVLVGAGAVLVALARVAAHVHHVQDVVAGLLLGLVAGAVGIVVAELAGSRLLARTGRRVVQRRGRSGGAGRIVVSTAPSRSTSRRTRSPGRRYG
jgi:membrane-associated phospholipid phosphatase